MLSRHTLRRRFKGHDVEVRAWLPVLWREQASVAVGLEYERHPHEWSATLMLGLFQLSIEVVRA